MCRNIRTLFNFEPPATEDEIRAASLQFVRKISGFSKPSQANEAAFDAAVDDIASISGRLLARARIDRGAEESAGGGGQGEGARRAAVRRHVTRDDAPHATDACRTMHDASRRDRRR